MGGGGCPDRTDSNLKESAPDSDKRVQHSRFGDKELTLFQESVDPANVLCVGYYCYKRSSVSESRVQAQGF